jgi:ABC-type lipoprotein export system ATPase subunit
MNLTKTRQILEIAWRLSASGKISNMPIFTLVGDTGIGKSTIMQDFSNYLAESEQARYFSVKY